MIKAIEAIRKSRSLLLESIKDLSAQQLNLIPVGYSNNIAWNLGHLLVVQQGICYKKAGLPTLIYDDLWEKFGSGSRPTDVISSDEIENIKALLFISLDQLETDYNKRIFNNYPTWFTRNGMELNSIDDALQFLLFHERLHAESIATIKKMVIKQTRVFLPGK